MTQLEMFSMDNEFAYIITDTSKNDANIQPYFDMAEEGNNLGFIYNYRQMKMGFIKTRTTITELTCSRIT